jgi:hypothetical protein
MPIDIAIAKEYLTKIDEELESPHLLIGGLAVEQYYKGRDSKDIDLVCDHSTAKSLLSIFPSGEWDIIDHNDDEYRPSYEIKNLVNDGVTVIFGPKISEREPYNYLNWEAFREGAQPFKYKNIELKNILIPSVESLAFTKLVSAVERKPKSKKKSLQDFEDYINLSNHKTFHINKFIHILKKANLNSAFVKDLSSLVIDYSDTWESSNIKYLFDTLIFGRSQHEVEAESFFREGYVDNSEDFKNRFSLAKSLRIAGYAQNRMAITYASEFERILDRDGSIRLIVMDPDKPGISYANKRSSNPVSKEEVKFQHSAAISKFKGMVTKSNGKGEVKIKVIDLVIPYTIYAFDIENEKDGSIYVWLTPYRKSSADRPGFCLTKDRDSGMYSFFKEQFEMLWNATESEDVI